MKKQLASLILVLIFALVAGNSTYAKSFDVGGGKLDAYASIRAFTMFNHVDGGDVVDRDHSQFSIGVFSHSRIGVKWEQGSFTFHNELGMGGSTVSGSNVTLRLLYGEYKFAGGEKGRIRIGQFNNIASTGAFYDHKLNGDDALFGFGTLGDANRRVGINYEIGGFSLSALSMRQDSSNVLKPYSDGGYYAEFEELMPRIEASYSISDVFKAGGSVVHTSVKADHYNSTTGQAVSNQRYGFNAYHLMAAAAPKISDNVRIIISGFYSVNGGTYGMTRIGYGYDSTNSVGLRLALPELKAGTDKAEMDDTAVAGGAIALHVENFEVGFGYQNARNDAWIDDINGMSVYTNYRFNLSPNFKIVPEFGYYHCGDMGNVKNTKGYQAGMQFRIDI